MCPAPLRGVSGGAGAVRKEPMAKITSNLRATSFDVAALAGVSQSAVSRAFTPGASISEKKRQAILEAARKLAYVPNSIASSLTTKRTNIVAIILGNMENPFYIHVLNCFIARLQAQGMQVLSFGVEKGGDSDEAIMRVLRYQVDGVILTSAQLSTRMTSMCHDRGIPIVLFNRNIPGSDAAGVWCDNETGGRVLAETFLQAGARSFLMLKGDPRGSTSQDRVRGFVERLLEAGVPRSAMIQIDGGSTYHAARRAVEEQFAGPQPKVPDAVFGVNDIMAMGAMDALRLKLGLRIPEDVMVAGFDDIPESRWSSYRLTTFCQPVSEMVEEALTLLTLESPGAVVPPGAGREVKGHLVWRDTIPGPRPANARQEDAAP